ncbi:hypothetical protein ACFWBT_29250, partial [Streptomyces sp. NPDC060027]
SGESPAPGPGGTGAGATGSGHAGAGATGAGASQVAAVEAPEPEAAGPRAEPAQAAAPPGSVVFNFNGGSPSFGGSLVGGDQHGVSGGQVTGDVHLGGGGSGGGGESA